jgi:hypothetical protein
LLKLKGRRKRLFRLRSKERKIYRSKRKGMWPNSNALLKKR